MQAFNYSNLFRPASGAHQPVPFVGLTERSTDVLVPYYQGVSRLYNLSETYYGSAHYEQLILLANPDWVSEFDIPDGTMLRLPFPLANAMQELATAQSAWLRPQIR